MRILGLIIIIALLALGMGSITPFIDLPSALVVLGFTIGALIFSGAGIANMFSISFAANADAKHLAAAARGWAQARSYSIASGFIGTLLGFVIMLKNIDDLAAIGPGLAICILTMLYGLIIAYGICLPVQSNLEDRVRDLT